MTENVPNLMKTISWQILEVQWISNRINIKKTTQRHIIIKLLIVIKWKRKFKAVRGKKPY